MVRQIVQLHVCVDLAAGPFQDRTDGVIVELSVPLDETSRLSRLRLIPANPAKPGLRAQLIHGALHRFDLVGGAASVLLHLIAKIGIDHADRVEISHRIIAGAIGPDVEVESAAHLLHERMRLGEEKAGGHHDDLDILLDARRQVDGNDRIRAEAGGEDNVAVELRVGPFDDFRRVGRLKHVVERVEVELIVNLGHVEISNLRFQISNLKVQSKNCDHRAAYCSRSNKRSIHSRGTRRPLAIPRRMSFLFEPWKSLPPVIRRL